MKAVEYWFSERVQQNVTLARWGTVGRPVLLFPTAGGDAEEAERFHAIASVAGLLEAGRIKVYSVDSISGRSWMMGDDPRHSMWLQNQFDRFLAEEVVPAIRDDCNDDRIEVISAGASVGAFWAVEVLTRHPELFRAALCMSGTYDLSDRLHGHWSDDFYFSSPVHFLPDLDGFQLDLLRTRFVLFATGSGDWERPERTWQMSKALGAKDIPHRVDQWDRSWPHDWPTWRAMLPRYLEELA